MQPFLFIFDVTSGEKLLFLLFEVVKVRERERERERERLDEKKIIQNGGRGTR